MTTPTDPKLDLFTVIQIIKTTWTKAHRGGDTAWKRNAVPESLPLPLAQHPGAGVLFVHRATYAEEHGFSSPLEKTEIIKPSGVERLEAVRVRLVESGAEIVYRYDGSRVGAPARSLHPRTFAVHEGDWLQIAYNGRFAWDGEWSYQKVTVNVTVMGKWANPQFFSGNLEPGKRFWDMANIQ